MENLLILNVTIEQETAVEDLFSSKSWNFLNLARTISKTIKEGILSARIRKPDKLDYILCNDDKKQSLKVGKKQVKQKSSSQNDNVAPKKRKMKLKQVINRNDPHKKTRNNSEDNDCQECNEENHRPVTRATIRTLKSNVTVKDTTTEVPADNKIVASSNNCKVTKTSVKSGSKEKGSSKKLKDVSTKLKGDYSNSQENLTVNTDCTKFKGDNLNPQGNENDSTQFKGDNKEQERVTVSSDLDCDILNNDLEITNESNEDGNDNKIDETTDRNNDIVGMINTKDGSENFNYVKDKKHYCDKCGYTTNVKSNLNRHTKEMHSNVRYQCPICKKTYKGKHNAKMHEVLAHSNKIQCDKCDKAFSSISGLRNHSKSAHRKESLYKCSTCNRSFLYKSHYIGHMNKHNDRKPFACKKCEKPFSYKTACQLHEKNCSNGNFYMTHNTDGSKKELVESNYLCDICGVGGFKSKASLKMHHFYAHSDNSQCVCTLCGKFIKGIYSLRRHIKTQHEDNVKRFPCTLCDKSFTQRHVLKDHLKLHNKEYSCFCETCGKGFLTQFKMKEHARVHTGEKPFICTICNTFKTSTKTNLQKHLKTHNKDTLPRQPCKKKTSDKVELNKNLIINEITHIKSDLQSPSPKPVYLDSFNEQFEQSRLAEGQGHYTTLHGIEMENSTSKFPPSYNQGYNIVNENAQVNHLGDIDGNVARDSSGCYGNDSQIETIDQSQGLNILTIAMRIVDPEQY